MGINNKFGDNMKEIELVDSEYDGSGKLVDVMADDAYHNIKLITEKLNEVIGRSNSSKRIMLNMLALIEALDTEGKLSDLKAIREEIEAL